MAVNMTVTYLAGLYGIEEMSGVKIPVFTVLTRVPGEEIAFIHDRIPVILPKEAVRDWINPERQPGEIVKYALTEMFYDKVV